MLINMIRNKRTVPESTILLQPAEIEVHSAGRNSELDHPNLIGLASGYR